MKSRWISLIVFLSFTTLLFFLAPKSLPNLQGSSAWGEEDTLPFPKDATFTTLITTRRGIEVLTGDNHRNLYTGGSGTSPCPVLQINRNNTILTLVVSFVSTQFFFHCLPAYQYSHTTLNRRSSDHDDVGI